MKNKFKRALAIAVSLVPSFTHAKSFNRDSNLKAPYFDNFYEEDDNKIENFPQKVETENYNLVKILSLFTVVGLVFPYSKSLLQQKNSWLVDSELKFLLDTKLDDIKKNPDLYNDINSYVPPKDQTQKQISLDIKRSYIPGIEQATIKTLEPIIDKVLHYAHGKSGVDYCQGYNFVCMGIAFMVKQSYPNCDNISTIKLCNSIYSDILPNLNSYSQLIDVIAKENKIPEFFKDKYNNLLKYKCFSEEKVHYAFNAMFTQIICGWGICECKVENMSNYSSVGGKLVKDLLLYTYGKITKKNLEIEMADVMYKQCKEFLDTSPTGFM